MEGALVTSDAMSCQKKIVGKITDAKADYTIGLKQNQSALYKNCEEYFQAFSAELPSVTTHEKGHGRIEKREYRLLSDVSWLEQAEEWRDLKGLGMVQSTVIEKDETRQFCRYFITSLTDIDEFADTVRKQWSIKNQLHWCLDVIFREDASKARKELNVLRKTALKLVSQLNMDVSAKKIDV